MDLTHPIMKNIFRISLVGVVPPDFKSVLSQVGRTINDGDSNGVTPLLAACWNGNVEVVHELLMCKDIEFVGDKFNRCPYLAAIMGQQATSYPLQAYSNSENFLREDAVYLNKVLHPNGATQVEILNLLLHRFDVNVNKSLDGKHAVELALETNAPIEVVSMILQHEHFFMDARSKRRTLQWAAMAGKIDCLQAMKECPSIHFPWDMNMYRGNSLLEWAIKNLAPEFVAFLLDHNGVCQSM